MKIDKDFAVKVAGKMFNASEIYEINIDGGEFKMRCISSGADITIESPVSAVEFVDKKADSDKPDTVYPLSEMKQALKEVMVDMGGVGSDKEIKTDLILDGMKFGKLVFKYNKSTGGD